MELLVVFVALWYLVDMFVVQLYSYTRPMGYDITNCWKLSFDVYPEDADEYVNDTTQTQTEGEALVPYHFKYLLYHHGSLLLKIIPYHATLP